MVGPMATNGVAPTPISACLCKAPIARIGEDENRVRRGPFTLVRIAVMSLMSGGYSSPTFTAIPVLKRQSSAA